MSTFFIKLYRYFSYHRGLFLAFLICILLIGAIALFKLPLEDNIMNVLPEDSEVAKIEQLLEKTSNAKRIIFIIENTNKNIDTLQNQAAILEKKLHKKLPDSLITSYSIRQNETKWLNLLASIYQNIPTYLQKEDLQKIPLEKKALRAALKERFHLLFTPAGSVLKNSIVNDPLNIGIHALKRLKSLQVDDNFELVNQYLISKDSMYLLGYIDCSNQIDINENKAILKSKIEETLITLNQNTEAKTHVFGVPIIAQENAEVIKRDVLHTVNVAMFLLLTFLVFYFGTVKIIPGFLITILLSASLALFVMYLKGGEVSAISLGLGSVLLGTIIDYSLHLFTHLYKNERVEDTLKQTTGPLLVGSITTVLAFSTLLMIKSKALNDLAVFAASSMFFGAIFALIVIPVFYGKPFSKQNSKPKFIDVFAQSNIFSSKWMVIFSILLFGFSAFFVNKISFSEDFNDLNYMSPSLKESEKLLNKISNTIKSSLVVFVEEESLEDALEKTERVDSLLQDLKIKEKVLDVKSATSILFSQSKAHSNAKEWAQFWTPERVKTLKNLIKEEAIASDIKPSAFNHFIQNLENPIIEKNNKNLELAENYISIDPETNKVISSLIVFLKKEDKEMVKYNLKTLQISSLKIFDKSSLFKNILKEVKSALQKIFFVLIPLVLIILFLYFKQIELVLISFTPVLLSVITTFGLMAVLNISLNLLNIIIVVFIFGLGIDYVIFTLSALVRDYREDTSELPIVKSAVTLSAITTFIGIGTLIFAKHPALFSISIAGTIAILSVYLYTMVFTPFLFKELVYKRIEKGFEPITIKSIWDTLLSYSTLLSGIFLVSFFGVLLKLFPFISKESRQLYFHKVFNFWAKIYVKILFPRAKRTFINLSNETFEVSSVVFSNHQSLIDTTILVSLSVKMLVLTKDWVKKSPIFGFGSKIAEFYSVDEPNEIIIPKLQKKVSDGYSIGVFPEGTRSTDGNLRRFHRGAFHLATNFSMDMTPVIIIGTFDTIQKGQIIGQRRKVLIKILPRIIAKDNSWGTTPNERYKAIRNYYKQQFYESKKEFQDGRFFSSHIIGSLYYKGNGASQTARKTIQKCSYFEELLPYLQNEEKTLIVDESIGELTILQNLMMPNKQVEVFSSDNNLIKNNYLAGKTNNYLSLLREHKAKQVFYIGKKNISDVKKNLNEWDIFIHIFLKTGKITFEKQRYE